MMPTRMEDAAGRLMTCEESAAALVEFRREVARVEEHFDTEALQRAEKWDLDFHTAQEVEFRERRWSPATEREACGGEEYVFGAGARFSVHNVLFRLSNLSLIHYTEPTRPGGRGAAVPVPRRDADAPAERGGGASGIGAAAPLKSLGIVSNHQKKGGR